jgi:hypothetical protein
VIWLAAARSRCNSALSDCVIAGERSASMSCAGAADVICTGHAAGAVGGASGTPSRQDAPCQV